MKFTKSTAEVYLFEDLPGAGWAKFTLQDMGSRGRISIASDYGDWQNGWGSCGLSFKKFLGDLDIGYAAGKFGADRWFDSEGTLKQMKVDIIERRKWQGRDEDDKKLAREAWDEFKYLDGVSFETEFCVVLERDCPNLMKFFEYSPNLYHDIHPLFRRFWKEAWPLFLEELKKEVSKDVPVHSEK